MPWSNGNLIIATEVDVLDTNGTTVASMDSAGNIVGKTLYANTDLFVGGTQIDQRVRNDINKFFSNVVGRVVTGAVPIANSTDVAIPFDQYSQTDPYFDGSNRTYITLPFDGRYYATFEYYLPAMSSPTLANRAVAGIWVGAFNFANSVDEATEGYYSAGVGPAPTATQMIYANAGTKVYFDAWQSSGAQVSTVQLNGAYARMSCEYRGPLATWVTLPGGTQPPPPLSTYDTTYTNSDAYSYRGNDSTYPNTLLYHNQYNVHGSFGSSEGNQYAYYVGFGNMLTDLAGATTIKKVVFTQTNYHTHYPTGMNCWIGWHTYAANSFASTSAPPFSAGETMRVQQVFYSQGATVSTDITSWAAQPLLTGGMTGIVIGPATDPTDLNQYGYFGGPATLEVVYTK